MGAHVLRVTVDACDVAWLRPRPEDWGCDQTMKHYLCSTDADETQHGCGLSLASQVRPGPRPGSDSATSTPEESNAKDPRGVGTLPRHVGNVGYPMTPAA